ncbi:MAG: type VI secretion system tip protein VgrG [Labilithrix sp.]|nr:type VI secretion system tip protein VgrG [Labilithrix sp.]
MPATTLTVDGHALPSTEATGHEAVGEHFRVHVRARATDDVKAADLVGKDFTLKLETRTGDELEIAGVVVSAASTYRGGSEHLDVELGPEAELLGQGQSSRVFQGESSVDIAKAVLSGAGVAAARWSVGASPAARVYTAQYREDDWAFVERITREDGLYFFYDHDGGTTLVFADDSSSAPALDGTFIHRTDHGTTTAARWVSKIAARTVAVVNAFSTRDRDPLKPKLDVSATEKEGDGDLEIYAWPARAMTASAAKARAQTSLEALRARRLVVSGLSESTAIRCGKLLEIDDDSVPAALRELFCIAIDWTIGPDGAFRLDFTAVPKTVPYRLPHRSAARAPLGAETAYVRGTSGQEIDVDEHARIFAQPVWDRDGEKDDTCSVRARVGQPALARSMAIPRIGWGMLVGHQDDDVDRPWVMARLVDGTHPPPYKLPDHMTRTSWQTLTSASDGTLSEIVFEDERDAEEITIRASRDMAVEIGDSEARTVGNRHVLEVAENRTVTVDADDKLTVTKDQTTSVKGKETTTIEGSRSITVKGKEEDSVGGTRTEKTKADRTTDIGKKRTLTVGGAMSTKSKKTFTREVLKKHTVTAGGGWTTQADGGLVTTTKGDSDETVGAARTQNGKEGVQTLVKGDLSDTIAAAHAVTAKGSVGESAKGKMKLTVGAALTATAPSIEIVAESEITIACGGATITIKSSEVSIKAPTLAIAGPLVSSNGAQVKHNP